MRTGSAQIAPPIPLWGLWGFRSISMFLFHIPYSDNKIQETASDVEDLLKKCVQLTRTLASELLPPTLGEVNLVPTLEWLARPMSKNHGLQVDFVPGNPIALENEEIRILLFEAARELLFNMVKHAKIKTACMKLARTGNNVRIEVSDNGCGFDISKGNESLGLADVRQRLSIIRGSMNIESSP
jgi:signal transduction histidine kinase